MTKHKVHHKIQIDKYDRICETLFHTLCDEWLKINKSGLKESTYVKYVGMINKHIKPLLGNYEVWNIGAVTVGEFSDRLLTVEKLSPKTVKDILILLKTIYSYSVKLSCGKLKDIEIIYPKVPKKKMRILSQSEQKRFVSYLLTDTDKCKFGVLLTLMSGMRIGEICALRWENISLTDKTITVNTTMQRLADTFGHTKILIDEPKSETSVRVIPMTDFTVNLCETYKCEDPNAFVLTGSSENYIEPRTMQNKFKRYTEECGIENVHFHTLRHTFATRCVEVDFEIKSLSEILGHSSPKITIERYVHSSLELKRDNMNKLTALGY